MNTESVKTFNGKVEPYVMENPNAEEAYQFIRTGYFKRLKLKDGKEILSEIVSLKDNFNK